MEIRPADLGRTWQLALIERRASAHAASTRRGSRGRLIQTLTSAGEQPRRLGPLGRFWTRGTGFNDRDAAEALQRMGNVSGPMVAGTAAASAMMAVQTSIIVATNGPPVVATIFGTILAALLSAGLTTPGILLRRWSYLPVSQGEVEALLAESNDDLERSYLSLIRDALRQENVGDEAAEDVRKATRALAEVIDRLPPLSTATQADPAALRQEAAQLRVRANGEADPVTAASLTRQAEARERSAVAAERSSLVLRRTAALRDELAAQTEALRLGLAALYSGAGDAVDLSHLAATVRGVADEANAVADARAELDAYRTKPANLPVTPAAEEMRVQRIGSSGS